MDDANRIDTVEDVEPGIHRRRTLLPDGRYLIYYTFDRRRAAGAGETTSAAPANPDEGAQGHV